MWIAMAVTMHRTAIGTARTPKYRNHGSGNFSFSSSVLINKLVLFSHFCDSKQHIQDFVSAGR